MFRKNLFRMNCFTLISQIIYIHTFTYNQNHIGQQHLHQGDFHSLTFIHLFIALLYKYSIKTNCLSLIIPFLFWYTSISFDYPSFLKFDPPSKHRQKHNEMIGVLSRKNCSCKFELKPIDPYLFNLEIQMHFISYINYSMLICTKQKKNNKGNQLANTSGQIVSQLSDAEIEWKTLLLLFVNKFVIWQYATPIM